MADIIYTYKNQVYANITNKCDCACTFCIRSLKDHVEQGDGTLWHTVAPTFEDIKAAIDAFDFTNYTEFVFCGYGEPTCELDLMLATARYVKDKTGLPIRLNTNGLGSLYNKKDIVPLLTEVLDSVSVSMNAPDAESYQAITRPQFPDAYKDMLDFASRCKEEGLGVQLSIVDVLSPEDIAKCQATADERGIYLRIRKYGE